MVQWLFKGYGSAGLLSEALFWSGVDVTVEI